MLGINYFTLHYRLKNHSVEESCQKERYVTKKVASSGERYITIEKNKKYTYYLVRIKGNHIGTYKSIEEAIDARNKALAIYV